MNGLFITGTGTGVGKTYFTALLVRALRSRKIPALGLKPFLCGERTDAEILAAANEETLSLEQINPVWFMPPVAPYSACLIEDRLLDWDTLRRALASVQDAHPGPFLVEGAGGWLVPLDRHTFIADWARELGMPVVVVCHASLGTLNHTLLTLESIARRGLPILGIVMNFHGCPDDLATRTNPGVLEELSGLPVWKMESGDPGTQLPDWLLP
jgi:dethiobiotin synthetase